MGKKRKAKVRKGKKGPSKSKHKKTQVWKKYKDGKLSGKNCPRCGPGTLLGEHKNRTTCGRCKYSEVKIAK